MSAADNHHFKMVRSHKLVNLHLALFRDGGSLVQRVLVVEGRIALDDLCKLCLDVRIQLVVLDAVWGDLGRQIS